MRLTQCWYVPLLIVCIVSCGQGKSNLEEAKSIYDGLLEETYKRSKALTLAAGKNDSSVVRAAFIEARLAYKQMEPLFEFYRPEFAKKISGPAIDKSDLHAPERVISPTGFQVLEELIYPVYLVEEADEILKEAKRIESYFYILDRDKEAFLISEANLFESVKAAYVRIPALTLAGFDTPVLLNAERESIEVLRGIDQLLEPYLDDVPQSLKKSFDQAVNASIDYLSNSPGFNEFNRMEFVNGYLSQAYSELIKVQKAANVPNNRMVTAINYDEDQLFGEKFYEINFFAPDGNRFPKEEKVLLGRRLFYDVSLSTDPGRSCATCHLPEKGFADGLPKSIGINGSPVRRNAPTIINSGFQMAQFHDARTQTLEHQIRDVLNNQNEFHGSASLVVSTLNQNETYKNLFKEAYGIDEITPSHVQMALASYVRTINGFNSKFDRHLRGEEVLSVKEIRGFNLFMGKGKCGTCHFMPLFNGTVPPGYFESESEVIGVPVRPDTAMATLDPDSGKFYRYQGQYNLFAFKTPTVRNVGLTAPYMHNGAYETLAQVMDFYNRGGGYGIGAVVAHQTLPPDPLNLTQDEQQAIIAFMQSLTDQPEEY